MMKIGSFLTELFKK